MTGRGRGESKGVENVDLADDRIERDRQAQLEAARLVGMSESEIPIRGRGGFRQAELRTIPENISVVRAENVSSFRQVDVICNYVTMNPMKDRTIHMYRVDFEPQVESRTLMRQLFNLAQAKKFNQKPIYDGTHECRSGQQLSDRETTVEIQSPDDKSATYIIKFTYTGRSTFGPEMLRIYNTQIKSFLRAMDFYQPQPGIFVHPKHATSVGSDIMMLRGFSTSANIHDGNQMLMNFNAAHKLVQQQNVLQIMASIRDRGAANFRETCRSQLIGKAVVTSYVKRVYRIEDIDFDSSPKTTFQKSDGTDISFMDYYRSCYNLNVRDANQPLLVVIPNNNRRRDEGDTRETKLVPEFCNIAGLTESQRMDNRLKMDLIKASQVNPADRVAHLRQFLADFHSNREIKAQLESWGYSYGTEPLSLRVHVHVPTAYAFGRNCEQPTASWPKANPETADFNVNGLAVCRPIAKLAIIVPRMNPQQRDQCLSVLRQGFERTGLKADGIQRIEMSEGDSPAAYIAALRRLPNDVSAAIVIMGGQHKEKYDSIKKVATVERGLITQVVTARLLCDQRKAGGASTKIAIQIAAKVGGEPWWVDIPLKGSMICGYDTYHDTANRGRSHGAFLASMNDRYSRWYSKSDAHDRMDEMSSQVSANLREALNKYKEVNKAFPERVFIYRDGVGEGQLEHVFKIELENVKKVLKDSSPKSRLTVVIVNKRIGARFYMKSQSMLMNPPPGTVVDHGVTRSDRFDFYLISQSTRHGSITPTYYNIIHDENGFPPEIHQKLAYKLCLMYYNWTGTVRVPAPCQYAHKLALLCGEHLHAQPNAVLNDRLHFL